MITRVRNWLKNNGYEGVILTRKDNFLWLTKGDENHVLSSTDIGIASLLITDNEILMFADSSDAQRMRNEQNSLGAEVIEVPWYESMEEAIKKVVGGKNIVSDTGMLNTQNVQEHLIELRLSLDVQEVTLYRELGKECAEITEGVCFEAKPGQTENHIAYLIKSRCIEKGISPDCVLVGSDDRIIKYRHPMPTDRKVEKSLMVVLGGQKHGLYISMTRMVYFGSVPEDIARKYEKCQEIFAGMQLSMKDGLTSKDYFANVIALYEKSGYPEEWKNHHQGGSTGYGCREEVMKPDSQSILKKGQAYAWNPTIAGVKCEETTYLTEKGVEVFTRTNRWPVKKVETPFGSMDVAEIWTSMS